MYRIIKIDGTELGLTDSVNYIKVSQNGCYTCAVKKDADGIAFNSVAYNLVGHNKIEGADTAIVVYVDGGSVASEMGNRIGKNDERLAEVDEIAIELYEANLVLEQATAEQDEAIIEIYEMMEGKING